MFCSFRKIVKPTWHTSFDVVLNHSQKTNAYHVQPALLTTPFLIKRGYCKCKIVSSNQNCIWYLIGKAQPTLCLEQQTCKDKYFEEAWHRRNLVRSCSWQLAIKTTQGYLLINHDNRKSIDSKISIISVNHIL